MKLERFKASTAAPLIWPMMEQMNWTIVSFCVLGLWAMLSCFSGERRRQLNEAEARKLAEEADKKSSAEKK